MDGPVNISACLICKDEAPRVKLALDSLAWCDEIVVVDSGSTDGTQEICRKHPSGKVRLIYEPWRGFSGQREFAVSQCRNDWVLMLDADEECSPQLRDQIKRLKPAWLERVAIVEMPRHNYVALRHVRCWGPDYQSRLIHRARTEWDRAAIPEKRMPRAGFRVRRISGPLLHNRLTPYSTHETTTSLVKQRYPQLAETLHARGRRASAFDLTVRPAAAFVKYYFIKRGFLDGLFGLSIACRATVAVMQKYLLLYGRTLETQDPRPARNPDHDLAAADAASSRSLSG